MDSSPLNRLPGELRNYISELLLIPDVRVQVDFQAIQPQASNQRNMAANASRRMLFTDPSQIRRLHEPSLHALTQTCRQIRHETVKLFYESNTFAVRLFDVPHTVGQVQTDLHHSLQPLIHFYNAAHSAGASVVKALTIQHPRCEDIYVRKEEVKAYYELVHFTLVKLKVAYEVRFDIPHVASDKLIIRPGTHEKSLPPLIAVLPRRRDCSEPYVEFVDMLAQWLEWLRKADDERGREKTVRG